MITMLFLASAGVRAYFQNLHNHHVPLTWLAHDFEVLGEVMARLPIDCTYIVCELSFGQLAEEAITTAQLQHYLCRCFSAPHACIP